ncbi:glutathione S-transferase [Rhizobium sp. Leaf306]|uniref:glutathione S-transferase family protein n=1 Tax=Rhizobium sp. Leaf306 TaxID=1736330 RepID=UPI00071485D9|nr:glutathione S-transferase N-terminal domain-containing protein [Rhizobium sp. Leaf306]KQQ37917.1 glutathione S-transferase [Rhizobium sp. Leaf306]
MLTLYITPGTCSRASHIALAESGLDYQVSLIRFAEGEQRSPAYLKVNPKGRVPALVTDKGVLTETVALLPYIAQLVPEKNLAPLDDPFLFAKMQAFNAYLSSTVHINHAHGRRGARWADNAASHADMIAKVPQTMRDSFALIEDGLVEGQFVLGETFSVADAYLFVMTGWLESDHVDMAEFPKVAAHYRRIEMRPAVQRVLAEEAAAKPAT